MNIGIDARFFGSKGKGLGRYTQKLIEGLEKIDDKNQYVIFLRRENWEDYQPAAPNFKKALADYRWYSLAEQIFMPIKIHQAGVDLMHFPHFNVPVFYFGKFVVTIHDLILRHFPTRRASTRNIFVYWFKNLAYRFVIRIAARRAKKIIVPSNYVKEDVIGAFSINPDKVAVTYESAPEQKSNSKNQISKIELEKYAIDKPYLLYVGNAYPHKNLERLVEGFKILVEKYYHEVQLVLVGEEDYFYRRLKYELPILCHSRESGNPGSGSLPTGQAGRVKPGMTDVEKQIIFTGFVSDKDLRVLYQNATLYVFPSLCEGFGLPPLEAMAQGVPVVSSSATCLPEILGDAALYFDAKNPDDMAEKINKVLTDEVLRQNLISQGYEQIKKYSWQETAEETLKIYNTANN